MNKYIILGLMILGLSACSHAPETCDMHCLGRGGICERVEKGREYYNVDTRETQKESTRFVCSFNW